MALNPLLAKELANFNLKHIMTLLDFGNQRFMVDQENIELLEQQYNVNMESVKSFIKGNELYNATREFYRAINFDYNIIDYNGYDGAHKFDLNFILRQKYNYKETFDFVVNNGTSEHIFDQRAVFENIHNHTKNDGIMIHMLPFYSWINHGFFNFNPILFIDLAQANSYEIIDIIIGNRFEKFIELGEKNILISKSIQESKSLKVNLKKNHIIINPKTRWLKNKIKSTLLKCANRTKTPVQLSLSEIAENVLFPHRGNNFFKSLLKSFDSHSNESNSFTDLSIIAILRKKSDADFKVPYQGKYTYDF